MPHKIFFDEPLVKFKIDEARFPRVCPVCCKKGTRTIRITVIPGRKRALTSWWDPAYMAPRLRMQMMNKLQSRVFLIPVCEDHLYRSEDYCRLRTLCIIGVGLFLAASLFAFYNIATPLMRGQIGPIWAYFVIIGFAIVLCLTIYSFKPKEVEKAIKIIGFDASLEHVIVDFKNNEYKEIFIKENPTSHLVNWIIKM